jgi:ABC-type transport system substrate-binding protein
LVAGYRSGAYIFVDGLGGLDLRQLGGIPKAQVVTDPGPGDLEFWFNERTVAPNAQANGGTSIFADRAVRQAFTEGFDRCAAVRALLGVSISCTDSNVFTDEPVGAAFPDYDPTFHLPGYNPAAAAALLDRAGYRVVDGVRRYKDGKTPIQLTVVLTNGAEPSSLLITHMQQDWSRNLHVQLSITNDPNISSQPPQNSIWRGAFDLIMFGQGASAPDPVGYLEGFGPFDSQDIPNAQNTGLNNLFGIIDPYVKQRDQLGQLTLDLDQRVEVYRELDRYFAQQYYMEVLYVGADVALIKPTLCNAKQWPSFWYDTWNSADWYVAPSCPS